MARGRAGREAVSRLGGRSRLHPRPARAAAVPAARALGRGDARERRGLDSRWRRRGERGKRARKRRPADRGSDGGAHGARPVVRGARRPGPALLGQRAVSRVVTFGELLLRLSPPGEETLFESSDLVTCFGGAEANVAVALSHFGVRCDYVTCVPDNPIGDAGVAALEVEGVGTEWIARGGERPGIYFVEPGADLRAMRVVYDRAGSALARIEPRSIDWPRVLAGRLAERCGVKRVALTRREILGPRRHGWSAVLYDAETGSFAQSRRHCVDVVDRVGGGDSFAAALIARLVGGDAPAPALEFAVAASALKLTVPGDFSRASVREVEELLRT